MYNTTLFLDSLKHLEIILTDKQINQFLTYYELLIEWNKVMNLTGITQYEEVIQKHFIDSLSIVKIKDISQIEHVLDLGTGAGFPGIPLKIAFPNIKIVLMDSLNKRIQFLNEAISVLDLANTIAIHARAEEFGRKKEYRGQFDLCVSRAVAHLASLSEYCMPFLKKTGEFISYKSSNIETELEESRYAIEILGGTLTKVETFTLPNSTIERSLILIEKEKETPKIYARMGNKPAKEPLMIKGKK